MTHRVKNASRQATPRKSKSLRMALLTLGLILVGSFIWTARREKSLPPAPASIPITSGASVTQPAEPIPPFYESADAAQPLAKVLQASYFAGYPVVQKAYRYASEIADVVAQQPCYCHCDKFGHRSLLDCFSSDHGAG